MSICVPGAVAGLAAALARHGTLGWDAVIAPAPALAERGMRVDWFTDLALAIDTPGLSRDPAAAALISRPRLLIADEPTTALDVTIQAQILALMASLAAEAGTAILLITQGMGVVAELADRVCVMYGRRIVEDGPVGPLFASPRHPYTGLLLRTIPRLDQPPKGAMFSIAGNVPSHRDWPVGCRFRTRCDRADAACAQVPALSAPQDMRSGSVDEDRHVACFHPLKAAP